MRLVVAIDIGTQSTRSAVVGQDGAIVVSTAVDHELHTPQPGWAEQQPEGWWSETCQTAPSMSRRGGQGASCRPGGSGRPVSN